MIDNLQRPLYAGWVTLQQQSIRRSLRLSQSTRTCVCENWVWSTKCGQQVDDGRQALPQELHTNAARKTISPNASSLACELGPTTRITFSQLSKVLRTLCVKKQCCTSSQALDSMRSWPACRSDWLIRYWWRFVRVRCMGATLLTWQAEDRACTSRETSNPFGATTVVMHA